MDLTKHLTTRADDSHAAPVQVTPEGNPQPFGRVIPAFQASVRFFACLELNRILHRLCEPPSIPLSFSLATVLPRRGT